MFISSSLTELDSDDAPLPPCCLVLLCYIDVVYRSEQVTFSHSPQRVQKHEMLHWIGADETADDPECTEMLYTAVDEAQQKILACHAAPDTVQALLFDGGRWTTKLAYVICLRLVSESS